MPSSVIEGFHVRSKNVNECKFVMPASLIVLLKPRVNDLKFVRFFNGRHGDMLTMDNI